MNLYDGILVSDAVGGASLFKIFLCLISIQRFSAWARMLMASAANGAHWTTDLRQ